MNAALLQIARDLDIGLVCTNDVHYTHAEDARPHDILLCIQTAKKLADEDRMRYEGGQYYVKSEEEMKGLFPYAWKRWKTRRGSRIAAMWRSSSASRNCPISRFLPDTIPGAI